MNILVRVWLALRRAVLRWQIWETEHYLADCARDGLSDSLMLRIWRDDLAQMRCKLILLQPPGPADFVCAAAEACTELGADMPVRREPVHLYLAAVAFTAACAVVMAGSLQ